MKAIVLFLAALGVAWSQESAFQDVQQRSEKTNLQETLEIRDVRESSAKDIGEALAKVDGLSKIRKGGIANDIVLRGFQQDNVNVLIDGVRIYGACPNNMDPPAFHVDFAEVQEVEVTKGAFDTRNQGSLGGVVNIINKRPEQGLHLTPGIGLGSFGFVNPSITASAASEHTYALGGYSWRRSEPYRDGRGRRFTEYANYKSGTGSDAYRIGTAWTRFGFTVLDDQRIELAYTRQNGGLVLYPYLMMDAQYDNADRASASWAGKRFRWNGYFTRVRHWMTDEHRVSSNGAPRPFSMASFAGTRALGTRAEADFKGLTFGAEAFGRGWDVVNTMRMSGMYMDQHSLPAVRNTAIGAFADYQRNLGDKVRLNAGARFDTVRSEARGQANTNLFWAYKGTRSLDARDTNPSANARIAWSLAHGFELFAGVGHAVRVPDPQERYFSLRRSGSDWVGNPLLKPVKNTELDGGVVFRHRRLYVRPTVFFSRLDDFIAIHNQPLANPTPGIMNAMARSFENVAARMWGGELSYNLALNARWMISGGASYTRGSKDPVPGKRILSTTLAELVPLKGRTAVRYGSRHFFAEVEAIAAHRQRRVDTDLREDPTPGYALANAKAGIHTKRLNLSAGIDNLFDRFYYESFSYQRDPFRGGVKVPEPGRSLFLTAAWAF